MQYIPGVLTGKAYVATGSGEHAPGQPTLSTVVSSACINIYIYILYMCMLIRRVALSCEGTWMLF